MKYYSEIAKKVFDTEEELKAYEATLKMNSEDEVEKKKIAIAGKITNVINEICSLGENLEKKERELSSLFDAYEELKEKPCGKTNSEIKPEARNTRPSPDLFDFLQFLLSMTDE